MSTLRRKITETLTINRLPKLVCLLLAILVWMAVEHYYVKEANEEWDLNSIRISTPD